MTTKKTLKQLRDEVERAQLEAQLRMLAAPPEPAVKGLEIKPRTRVFVYTTPYKETRENMERMAKDLAVTMGEDKIAIVNVVETTSFREL